MKTRAAALTSLALILCSTSASALAAERADIIIKNAQLLTIDADRNLYENGAIVVRDGTIIAVGKADIVDDYTSDTVVDAGGDIVMPGMVNGHNHLSMAVYRGVRSTKPHPNLYNFFFPLEAATLNRDLIRVSAREAAIESAMAGVTTVTDMYYHEDEVARSVSEVGIRGVLGETVINFPVVDADQPYGGFEYAKNFIQEWKGNELITPAVAPHSNYSVSAEWLRACKELAEAEGVPYLIHLAETDTERDRMEKDLGVDFGGRTVVKYLEDEGVLGDSMIAAHVIYVNDDDIEILKQHGVGVSHNPKANGSRFSPSWRMYKRGVDVGLGTDGPLGVSKMDVVGQIAFAKQAAHSFGDPYDDTPFDWVYLATMGGARALDKEDEIGSLEVGKKADIIIIDTDTPNMQPKLDPYWQIAFSTYPNNVLTTIVNGKFVMRDRVIQNVDMEKHHEELRAIATEVQAFGLEM